MPTSSRVLAGGHAVPSGTGRRFDEGIRVTDYGHDLTFGAFLNPDARDHEGTVAQAQLAEDLGLDLVTFQDHPYQPSFLDTWTLLSYLASATSRIRLAPNVLCVPLRPPAVLARSAAALDILSGGRLELGLGAGYFTDAIGSMGGPERTAGENVDALIEAMTIIRALWTPGGPVRFEGKHYRIDGAKPGPAPGHDIPIWLGAYGPRMLRLTGREADAWIPTLAYAAPDRLPAMNATIDEAAENAGRDPAAIHRLYNVSGTFTGNGSGFLQGPPAMWAEQLAELSIEHGISGFVLGPGRDAATDLRRFAEDVAPAVREIVERHRRERPVEPAPVEVASARAAYEAAVIAEREESVQPEARISAAGRAGQEMLLAVHAHLRQELAQLQDVVRQVAEGQRSAGAARSHLNQMAMRQNYWTLGSFCAAYCRVVATHHAIEDARMFPDLRAADGSLGEVLDRLHAEHEVIAGILDEVDAALVAMVEDASRLDDVREAVDRLAAVLLQHLDDEEGHLLEPIGRLGIEV